ncbi:hypothetical protein Gotur_019785 [Gossypium turneri]
MSLLASINYIILIICFRRWRTNLSIWRSYTILIYCLMTENHAGEGFIWMSYSVPEIMTVILSSAHFHSNLWGKYRNDYGKVHKEYITMWNNQLGRVPQMDRALDLQPSLKYLQWYSEIGKSFLFGG